MVTFALLEPGVAEEFCGMPDLLTDEEEMGWAQQGAYRATPVVSATLHLPPR